MTDVLMPALSPTMEEGALAKWHVRVGDQVRSGDVIAEIETDKATMEVEAVDEGVIDALLVAEGTEGVKVNTPIARMREEGAPAASAAPQAAPPPPAAATPAAGPAPPAEPPSPAPPTAEKPPNPSGSGAGRIAASPLARRLAAQLGLDLARIKGSGPHGRVIRRDVEATQASPPSARTPDPTAPTPVPSVTPDSRAVSLEQFGIAPGSYDLIPLDGMRKTVARRMTDSFRDVPHFPLTVDIAIDALLAARARVNSTLKAAGTRVSVNDMIIKAAAAALRRVPEANASYTPEGIARHRHADISVAVAVEGGLITPIIFAAETKGVAEIASEMKDLAERARARKLKPAEYQGGTFSVSNLGMFGIRAFASIINQPQGAILSVGAGEKRAVVRDDALAMATIMTVTLTCDHRVVDGAVGARFLAAFRTMIEDPITMIA